MIRGDTHSEGTVFIMTNLKTRMEFVGISEGTPGSAVRMLLKQALLGEKESVVVADKHRELLHALRISQNIAKEWRVYVVDKHVLQYEGSDKVEEYVRKYETQWPKGYNIL